MFAMVGKCLTNPSVPTEGDYVSEVTYMATIAGTSCFLMKDLHRRTEADQ